MKLLLVTYGLNTVGGVQTWQHLFAHEIFKKGHDLTILEMYDYSETQPDKKVARNWDNGIRIIRQNGPVVQRGVNPKTNWAALKVVTNLINKYRLDRFIKKEKFDSILFSDPNFTFFFFSSTIKNNNCFVQFHSSFGRFKTTSRLRYLLTKRIHKLYKKFIFLSKGDMMQAADNGFKRKNLAYMNNFINETKFGGGNKCGDCESRQILVVGNLSNPDKQVDHVLKAFSLIENKLRSGWSIKIIGDGKYKNKLEQLCDELNIIEQVTFAGSKSNPAQDYFESAFFVLSSAFEGAPLTLLECVHTNLPAVAYDCSPSIKEIIKDGQTGFVVEKNNIKGLSNAMQCLIEKPGLVKQMSGNINEVKDTYSANSTIKKWEKLLTPKTAAAVTH